MNRESNIAYETKSGNYWVLRKSDFFEVYKTGVTHSTRCAVISRSFGLDRAIAECERREKQDNEKGG